MNILLLDDFFALNILLDQSPVVSAIINRFIQRAPFHISDFVIPWRLELFDERRTSLFLNSPSQAVFKVVNSQVPYFGLILENDHKRLITVR